MKNKKKIKIDYLAITLGIIAVIFTVYNVKEYTKSHKTGTKEIETIEEIIEIKTAETEETVTAEMIEEDRENAILARLENMGEQDRMQYYYGMFLRKIKQGNYQEAYDLLYDDFKNHYFPTIETFKTYMDLRYTSNMTVQYQNLERLGDIYVLWVNVADLSQKKEFGEDVLAYNTFEINVVIQEYDFNDYKLSFSIV